MRWWPRSGIGKNIYYNTQAFPCVYYNGNNGSLIAYSDWNWAASSGASIYNYGDDLVE